MRQTSAYNPEVITQILLLILTTLLNNSRPNFTCHSVTVHMLLARFVLLYVNIARMKEAEKACMG